MISQKARAAVALSTVFVLGAFTGAGIDHFAQTSRAIDHFDAAEKGSRHGVFMWSLDRKLHLSSSQQKTIDSILGKYDSQISQIQQQVDPQLRETRAKMRAEIRATLEPHQQPEFDRIMQHFDAVRGRSSTGAPPVNSSP